MTPEAGECMDALLEQCLSYPSFGMLWDFQHVPSSPPFSILPSVRPSSIDLSSDLAGWGKSRLSDVTCLLYLCPRLVLPSSLMYRWHPRLLSTGTCFVSWPEHYVFFIEFLGIIHRPVFHIIINTGRWIHLSRFRGDCGQDFGSDDCVYWHLVHSTRVYREYSALADLHTLQFTVIYALGFSVFTSRILTTYL
jgi:hypothetical protein